MIEDIEAGKVNCVIVKDLSRFGRDYIDTGRYLERLFPELGVRFISVTDGIDSMKQSYDMLLPIKNIFNEQYARDISKKIHATINTKQNAGEFIGAFTSYGYKKSPTNKNKLVIDEYPATVVRRVFSLYLQGIGKQSIAKLLNEEGILCPSAYKELKGLNYKNGNRLSKTYYWTYSAINMILKNEMYIGNMVQGKKYQRLRSKQRMVKKEDWVVVENTHEPIIDRHTWEKVQKLLTKRHRDIDLETNKNIFAGFIKCGDCGRAMIKNFWRRADGSKSYSFYCGTYKRSGKDFCTPHTLPFQVLEDIILGDLKTIIHSIDHLQELVKSQTFTEEKVKLTAETEVMSIKSELERIKKMKKAIYEDYREDLISKEEFISYKEDYLRKEEVYAEQIVTLENKSKDNMVKDVFETPWMKRLLEMKDIEVLDRDIIVEMLDEITVFENRKIKIRYNFSEIKILAQATTSTWWDRSREGRGRYEGEGH